MEILKTAECFPLSPEEPIFTIVIFQQNDQTYTARFNGRSASKTDINPEELADVVELDRTAFRPGYLEHFTRAEPNNQHYTKRPDLLSYYPVTSTKKTMIANRVLQEVQVYELFKRQPHPNIAEYHGCEVTNGKISGMCFKQYTQSLQQRLNLGHFNKRAFARSACLDEEWCTSIIEDIKKGLEYIHALGLVHNDITPANNMLDERDTAIIIDYGSCRAEGESLDGVGRTYEWYNDEVQISRQSNDLDALGEIKAWMFGKVDEFKFVEIVP